MLSSQPMAAVLSSFFLSSSFFFTPSPQETEISTRRKECEALEAEVKKKNQTCQTLVSAPKIYPDHWRKGSSLKLISTWKYCSRYQQTHQSLEKMSCSDSWVLMWKYNYRKITTTECGERHLRMRNIPCSYINLLSVLIANTLRYNIGFVCGHKKSRCSVQHCL